MLNIIHSASRRILETARGNLGCRCEKCSCVPRDIQQIFIEFTLLLLNPTGGQSSRGDIGGTGRRRAKDHPGEEGHGDSAEGEGLGCRCHFHDKF